MNLLRHSRRLPPDISLTPLIDVVFLLLIFFMVTAQSEREAWLQVRLPHSEQGIAAGSTPTLEVGIDAQGNYHVNGIRLQDNQPGALQRAMADASKGPNPPSVIIRADAITPHQAVVTVMEVAGRLGLDRLSIATRPRTAP